MEQRYAMVRQKDNVVDNVCMWDGDLRSWEPPVGIRMVLSDTANPGDTWDGGAFKGPTVAGSRAPNELSGVTRIVTRMK